MERLDWKKTVKLNILLLKIVGLWPTGDATYGNNLYKLYAVAAVLFQVSHIIFQIINLFRILDDLEAATNLFFILIMEILAVIKIYFLIKNMRMLKQLMITVNSDLFQPKCRRQRELIQSNLNHWTGIISTFRFTATAWLLSWCSFPILDKTYKEYRLPFLAWYPYDIRMSPYYELTYCFQVIGITYLTMSNCNVDTLIAAINMFIGAQFDILCDDLKNLHQGNENTSESVNETLKRCIHHHKEIIKFADYANKFYNWLLFFEFFVGGISIGLSTFQLTLVVPFTSEFYSFLSYSSGISVEVFMYCWFGNEIEVKSSELPYAIFESDWASFSPEVKKNLIFFMLRIQQPLTISALGLFNLSLETYMRILRTAWSYFALLRQVNSAT